MQSTMLSFIQTFSKLYPCGTCAEDFRSWMKIPGNQPRVWGQDEFGNWMCEAHNAVNVKLGKKVFDCSLWKERWRDGWKDGRCD
jgi:mitochondrial FAD-linked sulfhydryl oxidase